MITRFNDIIDIWITRLDNYNDTALCLQPAPGSWSLGQLYMHLLDSTQYYLRQLKGCLGSNEHADEAASPFARQLFSQDEFPDERIEGPASNKETTQPPDKEWLLHSLLKLKKDMNDVACQLEKNPSRGKTKHHGLRYFNASEWLHFSEMHMRHHGRQYERIKTFLDSLN
jgi:DinB superfamily